MFKYFYSISLQFLLYLLYCMSSGRFWTKIKVMRNSCLAADPAPHSSALADTWKCDFPSEVKQMNRKRKPGQRGHCDGTQRGRVEAARESACEGGGHGGGRPERKRQRMQEHLVLLGVKWHHLPKHVHVTPRAFTPSAGLTLAVIGQPPIL